VTDGRFVVISVAYDRHAGYDASLEWIAPELKDAGLSLIEDHTDGPSPSRTWAGTADGPTFERFADAWQLDDETNEPTLADADGHPSVHTYTFDGMNWETAGESPVTYATLHVVIRDEHKPHAHHPPPFTHLG
jgi:hypothetical protein